MHTQIAPGIFYTGVNERTVKPFESLWPIPQGISYNSYLIIDQKVVLIDASDAALHPHHALKLQEMLGDREIDYLIINHMEPDHSGAIRSLLAKYPKMTLVGNAKTMAMVQGFYDVHTNALEIKDNDVLDTGSHRLRFFMTPMVHWPETMMTYDETTQTLFSGDAFGGFGALNGAIVDEDMVIDGYWSEMRRYYASIVGKYGVPVQNALKKLNNLPISMICSTHGPVWKKYIRETINYYNQYSLYKAEPGVVIAYGSMYGNTALLAEKIAEELSAQGVQRIKLWDTGVTDISYILSDIFDHNALILGAPVYNNTVYPPMQALMNAIRSRDIKDRLYASFGTYAWGSAPINTLAGFAEEMKWKNVHPVISQRYSLHHELFTECRKLAVSMANKLKEVE
ncbi:MAG: FprA family A-type flavoprotein [Bacteroidales bacterium]